MPAIGLAELAQEVRELAEIEGFTVEQTDAVAGLVGRAYGAGYEVAVKRERGGNTHER